MAQTPTAIVTGASSGVGRETAVLLARAGHGVALVGRNTRALGTTANRITEEAGPTAQTLAIPIDLVDSDAPRQVIDQTLKQFGRIDVLVNNAGVAPMGPIETLTPDTIQQCIGINLTAAVLLTTAAWPSFKQNKTGIVVNISSMASIDPFPGFSVYAAAKVGLNMYTRCIASEGKRLGVRAVCIAPGAIETPMLRENFSESMLGGDQTLDPAAVAGLICDCVSGRRQFEPGQTIVINQDGPD